MKTPDVRRYVKAELPKIAAKMGLSEWNFVLEFISSKPNKNNQFNQADTEIMPDYHSAHITFNPPSFNTKAEIRSIIIHELIHVLQADWKRFAEQVDAAIQGDEQLLCVFNSLWRTAGELNRYVIERMLKSLKVKL